jgi:hypothetical protein
MNGTRHKPTNNTWLLVSMVTDTHATIALLLETVFSVVSSPRLSNLATICTLEKGQAYHKKQTYPLIRQDVTQEL